MLIAIILCVVVGVNAAHVPSATAATTGESILAEATKWSGTPYCFGGGSPNGPTHGSGNTEGATQCPGTTTGFDCTGLTIYAVYQATGKILSHEGHQAVNAVGQGAEHIYSKAELKPGDLVYFGGTFSNVEHVGVYAGSGMMWDANIAFWVYPDGVHERSMASVETSESFVGAVRFTGGGEAPSVTTTSLPSTMVGDSYNATLSASGGKTPYSWRVAAGALPAGLTLASDGAISGIVTSAGVASFTAEVTDGAAQHSTANLSINVERNFTDTASTGPGEGLEFNFNAYGDPAWHPQEIAGPSIALGRPAIAEMSNDETVVAVEAPDHSLRVFFNEFGNGAWHENIVAGPGTTYSAPSLAEMSNNETVVAVQGAADSLHVFFNEYGNAAWHENVVAGPSTTYSAPSVAEMSNNETAVAVQGPKKSLHVFFNQYGNAAWHENLVAGTNTSYGQPSIAEMSNDETAVAVQGPKKSLDVYFNAYGVPEWLENVVAGTNTAYSAPSVAEMSTNETAVAVQGPKKSLHVFFNQYGNPTWHENVVAGPGSSDGQPSIAEMSNDETAVAVQGPKSSLDVYFNAFGVPEWLKNVVAGSNTTYGAPSIAVPGLH